MFRQLKIMKIYRKNTFSFMMHLKVDAHLYEMTGSKIHDHDTESKMNQSGLLMGDNLVKLRKDTSSLNT